MTVVGHAKLRFGVMCAGERLEAASAAALRAVLAVDEVALALVIVETERSNSRARGRPGRAMFGLYQNLLARRPISSRTYVDVSELLADAPRLEAADVDAIREHE